MLVPTSALATFTSTVVVGCRDRLTPLLNRGTSSSLLLLHLVYESRRNPVASRFSLGLLL